MEEADPRNFPVFQSSNSILSVVDFWGNLVFFHFFGQFMTFYAFYARKVLKKMVFIRCDCSDEAHL